MAKKLTVGVLEQKVKKLDSRIPILVNGYSLEVDATFKKTKITALLNEITKKFELARIQNNIDILEIFTPYVLLLILKYFTSLEIPDELENQLKVLDMLVDGDFLNPIYAAMPPEELSKVYDAIADFTDKLHSTINTFAEQVKNVELENPELLDKYTDVVNH